MKICQKTTGVTATVRYRTPNQVPELSSCEASFPRLRVQR